MSSSKLDIFNKAVSTLRAAQSGRLSFVKNVHAGYFEALLNQPAQSYPNIVVEVDDDGEEFFTTGMPPALRSHFKLFVFCRVFETKPETGLIGDAAQTPPIIGLVEFVDIVKNVLQADMSLGNTQGMQKVSFPACPYSFAFYPIREAKLHVTLDSQLTTTSH